jgi:hypothetical protein
MQAMMRTRTLFKSLFAGLAAIALLVPAGAQASVPEDISDYVSDNTSYFVAALLAAILLLCWWSA